MPRGKRTSISEAAQAKALADIGYQGSQIADATGLPTRTVDDIINGRNGWREIIANDQHSKTTGLTPAEDASLLDYARTEGATADREQNRQS